MTADAAHFNQALARALASREWPIRTLSPPELARAVEQSTAEVERVYYSTSVSSADCHATASAAVAALLPWIDAVNLDLFVGRAIATLQRG